MNLQSEILTRWKSIAVRQMHHDPKCARVTESAKCDCDLGRDLDEVMELEKRLQKEDEAREGLPSAARKVSEAYATNMDGMPGAMYSLRVALNLETADVTCEDPKVLIAELVNGWAAVTLADASQGHSPEHRSEDRAAAANTMDAVCRKAWKAIGRSLDEPVDLPAKE